ncbi:MAG: AMP-binding protein, partial [Clostridia bacterium]|nr:AMP-binding protein [Clostridia bacterium]
RVVLLDDDGRELVGKKKVGEICVIGTPLALGYYNNREQTEKSFTPDLNQTNFPQTVYHTGDLGFYNNDGELVFNGRKDFQIKYQGHRIELEEIEKAMTECEGVVRSCAIFEPIKEKLYGFYIGDITKQELRQKLREVLPEYMIPTPLIKKDEFPITKNGKIDRKKLMEEK